MKKFLRKTFSVAMALAVSISSLSIPAFAEENENSSEKFFEEESENVLDESEDILEEQEEPVLSKNDFENDETIVSETVVIENNEGYSEQNYSDENFEDIMNENNEEDNIAEIEDEGKNLNADIVLDYADGDTENIRIEAYADPYYDTEFKIYFWQYDGTFPSDADEWNGYFTEPFWQINIVDMDDSLCIYLPVDSDVMTEAKLCYDENSVYLDFTLPADTCMDTEISTESDTDAYVMAEGVFVNDSDTTMSYLPIAFSDTSLYEEENDNEDDIDEIITYTDEEQTDEMITKEYIETEEYTEEYDNEFSYAEEETETEEDENFYSFDTMYFVNPVYEGIISEDDLDHTEADDFGIATLSSAHYAETLADAGADMREAMENRETPFTIKYIYPGTSIDSAGLTDLMWDVWDEAFAHTGVPTEGDYMRWQYGGWSLSASYAKGDGFLYLNMVFNVTYYSTYEQEQEVTSKLNDVFAQMNLGCKSDYERVCAIYDYICANITYDYDNLYDSSYMTKFSAYGALCDGTAVCQGYAVLLYRMLLEAGVDCRVITGTGNGGAHAWNIIKLGDKYYNVDSTWDAGRKNYSYFLKSDANFTSHTRGSDYSSSAFYASYPMGTSNYNSATDGGNDSHHTPGEWAIIKEVSCTDDGLRRKTCTVCGETVEEETTKAYGHSYITETIPADCETEGFVIKVCEHCEDTYISEIIPANGHSYISTVVTEPTCTKSGYTTYVCSVCGDTYVGDHTDPLGHDMQEQTVEPTCVNAGETIRHCNRCNEDFIREVISPTGVHTFDSDGVCTVCNEKKEEAETEHIHNYDHVEQTSATCGYNGIKIFRCSECGDEIETVMPMTGHHDYQVKETVESTCTEHGYVLYYCPNCNSSEYKEEIPLADHVFSEATVEHPTCLETGIIIFTCENCGHSYEDVIDALWHEPIVDDDGNTVCERCGEIIAVAEIPETEEPETYEEPDPEDMISLGQYDISEAVITGIEEEYPYTGEEVKPKPTIMYGGNLLIEGEDYILIYSHDDEVGYASISIVGIGDYAGEVTYHYTIENVEHGDAPDLLSEETETESKAETEIITELETEAETDSETTTEIESEENTDSTESEQETEEVVIYDDSDDLSDNIVEEEALEEDIAEQNNVLTGTSDTSDDEEDGAKGGDYTIVQTGDSFNFVPLIICIVLVCALAVTGVVFRRKKDK